MFSMGLAKSSILLLIHMKVHGRKEYMKAVAAIVGMMETHISGIGKVGKCAVEGL